MRVVVCGANRLAFLHAYFEFSSSFLQKYECIQLPPAALSQFFHIWVVFFCTNPVATILSFRSFLRSLSLLCNISACFVAFDVRPKDRVHRANFDLVQPKFAFALHTRKSNLGSTQVEPTFRSPAYTTTFNLG